MGFQLRSGGFGCCFEENVKGGEIVGAEIWNSVVERGLSDHVPISVHIRLRKTRWEVLC